MERDREPKSEVSGSRGHREMNITIVIDHVPTEEERREQERMAHETGQEYLQMLRETGVNVDEILKSAKNP